MKDYIVQVTGANGETRWVIVPAPSPAEARRLVPVAGTGWKAIGGVYDDVDTAHSSNPTQIGLINSAVSLGMLPMTTIDPNAGMESWGPEATEALTRESFEFGPGFERGLANKGINLGRGGLQARIAQNQQRALEDRFFTQQALTPGGEALTDENAYPTFANFLQTNPLFGQAGAVQARGLLDKARGFTSPGMDALPSDLAGSVLNPATTGEGNILANVALDAGRQRFGSLSRFLPSAGNLSQSYLAQDQPTRGTFADYLNTRIFG